MNPIDSPLEFRRELKTREKRPAFTPYIISNFLKIKLKFGGRAKNKRADMYI